MNVLDLFSGCGGFSQGFKQSGYNLMGAIDCWDTALFSYIENHASKNSFEITEDLRTYTPQKFEKEFTKITKRKPNFNVIIGGPPCLGFSLTGKRDLKDPRNSLFMEFVKYVRYFKPKAFVMENVLGILSMKTKKGVLSVNLIMKELRKGYNVEYYKLNSADFGVPQNRFRVFFIGIRKDLNIIPIEPLKRTKHIPVGKVILPRNKVSKDLFLNEKQKKRMFRRVKLKLFTPNILDLNKPSRTILASDVSVPYVQYNGDIRRVSINELKRIQSFPANYWLVGSKTDQIRQIGNAVSPKMAFYIAEYLKPIFSL